MARSYFKQLLQGAQGGSLTPSRPISNLWKTAQIDSAHAEQPASLDSSIDTPRLRRARPLEAATQNFYSPHSPAVQKTSEASTDAEIHPAAPRKSKNTNATSVVVPKEISGPLPLTGRVAPSDLKPAIKSEGHARTEHRTEFLPELPSRSNATTVKSQSASIQSIAGSSDQPPARHNNARSEETRSEAHSSDPQPQLDPESSVRVNQRTLQAQPANGNKLREEISAGARAEITRRFSAPRLLEPEIPVMDAPARQPQPTLLEPAPPQRVREPQAGPKQGAAAGAPREEQRSIVQIGKIEVQVISPPVTSFRPAVAPVPPKPRLARGYDLWQAR